MIYKYGFANSISDSAAVKWLLFSLKFQTKIKV